MVARHSEGPTSGVAGLPRIPGGDGGDDLMPANKLVDPLGAPWRSVWHAVKEWADGLHQWPRWLTGQSPPPDKRQRTVAAWAAGAILLAVAVAGLTSTVPNVPTHKAAAPTPTTTSTSTSTSTSTTPDSSTSPTSPAAPAAPASRAIPDGVLAATIAAAASQRAPVVPGASTSTAAGTATAAAGTGGTARTASHKSSSRTPKTGRVRATRTPRKPRVLRTPRTRFDRRSN